MWEKRLEPRGGHRGARRDRNVGASGLSSLEVFGVRTKKCGVEIGDPNLRFQPRLPGSVVGEASMRQVGKADKITGVIVLW